MKNTGYNNGSRMSWVTDLSAKAKIYGKMEWYFMAAQLEDGWSQFELGLLYTTDGNENLEKAKYWLSKAASCEDRNVRLCAERELHNLELSFI